VLCHAQLGRRGPPVWTWYAQKYVTSEIWPADITLFSHSSMLYITKAHQFCHLWPKYLYFVTYVRALQWRKAPGGCKYTCALLYGIKMCFRILDRGFRISALEFGIPAVHICDQPTCACCLFRAQGQPTVTGVLLSMDQSRGMVYLWHCVQVTSRRRLPEDIWRHFCLTVLTISYVDSYRDIDSYVTIPPSLPT